MVWTIQTGPDKYEEEHLIGKNRVRIYRWGKKKNLGKIKVKHGFFERKTITAEDVEKINAEVREGTFPKALGILVDGTTLERRHLMILDYCRAVGWLPELRNLKIVERG